MNMETEFKKDLTFAEEQRRKLKPFYKKYSYEGRYIFVNKESGILGNELQKKSIDTILQKTDKKEIYIEEKIVRWKGKKLTAFALETHSCTVPGREKDGWMKYGEFDILLYGFTQADGSIEVYVIPFAKLKKWFWEYYLFFTETITDQINKSACRLVDINHVEEVIGFKKFTVK